MSVNVVADCLFEFAGAVKDTSTQLFLGDECKPPFDQVNPRRTGGREMQMKPRPLNQPASNGRRLMRCIVIQNKMDIKLLRHCVVEFKGSFFDLRQWAGRSDSYSFHLLPT